VGKSSAPRQSIALNPMVETTPKRQEIIWDKCLDLLESRIYLIEKKYSSLRWEPVKLFKLYGSVKQLNKDILMLALNLLFIQPTKYFFLNQIGGRWCHEVDQEGAATGQNHAEDWNDKRLKLSIVRQKIRYTDFCSHVYCEFKSSIQLIIKPWLRLFVARKFKCSNLDEIGPWNQSSF
jgi:hypothetical protein